MPGKLDLQVVDGTYYNPLTFEAGDVNIVAIAHQLALKCRWNGNTNDLTEERNPVFYSVAQHSCIVHDIAKAHKERFVPGARWDLEPCPSIYGLLHDAAEAPLIDLPRPLRKSAMFSAFNTLEDNVLFVILQALQVPVSGMTEECVRRIDNSMIFWERDALIGQPVEPYLNEADHPGGYLTDWVPNFFPWSPGKAKREFLARYYAYRSTRPLGTRHAV